MLVTRNTSDPVLRLYPMMYRVGGPPALGYVGGTGLLFQASMLFIGLIAVLILQPFFSDAPFLPVDVLVVFLMGLICFIPFALFVRGVIRS